jgi:DICT domain-containing protein
VGQIALSYDPDEQTAAKRAMDQFRWFTGGWRVNAELPLPASFEQASKAVLEQDVSEQMPCGPDVQRHVAGIRQFEGAGFTHIAFVQVGADTQEGFISWAASGLLPALRAQSGVPVADGLPPNTRPAKGSAIPEVPPRRPG